nr:GNAT family N-acetyltransferase [Blastococcus saxobsidens]
MGGFGAVALTADDEEAGYLLGVVSADRLAVVHAVAVHPRFRGHGIATRLLERFADLAGRLAARCGAHPAPSPGHAGPGRDRVVFTRGLPLR